MGRERDSRINMLAKEFYECEAELGTSQKQRLLNMLAAELFKDRRFFSNYEDVFSETFMKCTGKSHDKNGNSLAERDFVPYFLAALKNANKSRLNKKTKDLRNTVSIVDDEGEYIEIDDRQDPLNANIENVASYKSLLDIVIAKKKEYANRKTINYTALFFTESTSRLLQQYTQLLPLSLLSEKDRQIVLDCIEIPFLITYTNLEDCTDISQICTAGLRKKSHFTGKDSDCGECGYPLENMVYQKYIAKTHGKEVTPPAITEQRTKYSSYKNLIN